MRRLADAGEIDGVANSKTLDRVIEMTVIQRRAVDAQRLGAVLEDDRAGAGRMKCRQLECSGVQASCRRYSYSIG